MSFEHLTGPQQVSLAARRIADNVESAHLSPAVVEDFAAESAHPAARIFRFGVIKLVTDQLADTLPSAADVDGAINEEPTLDRRVAVLRRAYDRKLVAHVDDSLRTMLAEPGHRPLVEILGRPPYSDLGHDEDALVGNAHDNLRGAYGNAVTVNTGLFRVAPLVYTKHFQRPPESDDIITILGNSGALTQRHADLSMEQQRALLDVACDDTAVGEDPNSYGYDYRPEIFAIDARRMRYVTPLHHMAVEDAAGEQKFLSMVGEDERPLGCPARKLLSAVWTDMVATADQQEIFKNIS